MQQSISGSIPRWSNKSRKTNLALKTEITTNMVLDGSGMQNIPEIILSTMAHSLGKEQA